MRSWPKGNHGGCFYPYLGGGFEQYQNQYEQNLEKSLPSNLSFLIFCFTFLNHLKHQETSQPDMNPVVPKARSDDNGMLVSDRFVRLRTEVKAMKQLSQVGLSGQTQNGCIKKMGSKLFRRKQPI